MKSIPAPLLANLQSATPTVAHALKITRTDGQVFGFTSAVQDVTISAVAYDASQGLDISSIVTTAGLGVDNLELTTLDDGSLFSRADVIAGIWQNAAFLIFRYNWKSPSDGIENLMAGTIGQVQLKRGTVVAELRGLQQYLQQPVGDVTSRTCRARFADFPTAAGGNLCRLAAATWTDALEVTAVGSLRGFTATPAAGLPGDSDIAKVALLLHGDGADASTTITDSSPSARSCTAVGNARLRTAAGGGQVKFGSAAIYVDGTADCVTIADTPNISLTGDFCLEGWLYVSAASGSNQAIVTLGGPGWELYRRPGSGNALTLYDGSANQIIGGTAIATGGWVHWAWARTSGVHSIYLAGARQGTYSHSATIDPTSIILGAFNAGGTTEPMTGYFDDVRLSVGTDRGYSGATISVPTAAFYDSAPTGASPRAADWYREGIVTWLTGANAGLRAKVKAYSSGHDFELLTDMPNAIAIGDTISALAGCSKRLQDDCRDRFNNVINFQGEPHLPGLDALTKTPDVSA